MDSPSSELTEFLKKDFPLPILSIDIIIWTIYKDELCTVLLKTKDADIDGYILPSGILRKGKSIEENLDEILKEKTGITDVYKEQLFTFGDPGRDTRGHIVSLCYFVLVNAESFLSKVDFTKVDIVRFKDLKKNNLFYDYEKIIKYAKQRLEWKLEYTTLAKEMLPTRFKMSDLQKIYEIILGKTIDKRNFQKRILHLDILKKTGEKDSSTNRPAELFSFKDKKIKVAQML